MGTAEPHRARGVVRGGAQVVLPGDLPAVEIEEDGFVTFVFSPAPEQLAAFLTSFWGLKAEVRPELPLDALEPARVHDHHAQFDARALLAAVEPSLPDDAYSMTVLIARDLVVDGQQEFAYGYGLHVDRLAVASFAQLDPLFAGHSRQGEPEFQRRIRERTYKLLAHEVGHTLGIGHCEVHACVMNGVAHLAELDATPLRLCPLCLRKLIWLVGIDPVARYRALAAHYERSGLDTPAAWIRARLARLEPARP